MAGFPLGVVNRDIRKREEEMGIEKSSCLSSLPSCFGPTSGMLDPP